MPESHSDAPVNAAEQTHRAHEILDDPEFKDLARSKNSISTVLTLIMLVLYFGYIGLLATRSPLLASKVGSGSVSLGIPFGIGVIVIAWILTGIYVTWANSKYDAQVARVKSKIK